MVTHPIAFINGRYYDTRQNTLDSLNILLQNGQVSGLGYMPDDGQDAETLVYDLKGYLVIPGIIDTWAHVREPGEEGKETLATATTAAVRNGITAILTTPHGSPCVDQPEMVGALLRKASQVSGIPVYPIGALSKGLAGTTLAELGLMRDAGTVAFCDGNSISDAGMMQQAMHYAAALGCPIVVSPDEASVHRGGSMHDGPTAIRLGLKGIPAHAETVRLGRDLELAAHTGAHLHVFPVSAKHTVDMIRDAKKRGIAVTCGTAPHYLYFCDTDLMGYDTHKKVFPPFRTPADQEALLMGLQDGTIDCIASHHHPMTVDEKRTDFVSAAPGISGLDTFVVSVFHRLAYEEKWPATSVLPLITRNPRQIFKLPHVGTGLLKRPSFTVLDPNGETHVSQSAMISKGKNTPFLGKTFRSRILMTVIDGHVVYQNPILQAVPADALPNTHPGAAL